MEIKVLKQDKALLRRMLQHISLKPLLLLPLLFFNMLLSSQNLLPDRGFEKLAHSNCVSPEQAFKKMQFWYPLNATPDLFESSCLFDEMDFIFWDESLRAYEGNNYAGLWSRWNPNGSYFTEGIASPLIKPLEAGKIYMFEMAIYNQGSYQGLSESLSDCVLEPEKHIDLYLSHDSIEVINDFSNGTASTSATLVATLNSEEIQGDGTEDWTLVSTCFVAQGGEKHFAIIMPLGTFGDLPPCATTQASSGTSLSFYYHIDATSVTELSPDIQEKEVMACEEQSFEVNLLDLFDAPLLEDATFIWEDGQEGVFRTLSEKKDYTITASLSCTNIPLQLKVVPQICQTNIFVPNAFSPNSDGYNDLFQVFLADESAVRNFQLTIFDRWGNSLFQTNNPALGWDGKSRNQELSPGVYLWFISYDIADLDGVEKVLESGDVLILR